MQGHFPEALVNVPEEIIQAFSGLPDPKDCHVLAAAILSKANVIVTQNTKHFPKEYLEKYGVLCHSADDFLIHQYHLDPQQVLGKLDEQAANFREERSHLVQTLAKAVPKFSELVNVEER